MSKAVQLDHEFNLDEFTRLLNLAKGSRSQTEYAKASGLSLAYMCKYLNGKFSNPPTPNSISKMASAAKNGVSRMALFDAAGYDVTKYTDENIKNKDQLKPSSKKLLMATITTSLSEVPFKWSYSPDTVTSGFYDYIIQVHEAPFEHWCFHFIYNDDLWYFNDGNIVNTLGSLILSEAPSKPKISFVFENQELYELYKETPIYLLNAYVSIILINIKEVCIIKEEYLNVNEEDITALNSFNLL